MKRIMGNNDEPLSAKQDDKCVKLFAFPFLHFFFPEIMFVARSKKINNNSTLFRFIMAKSSSISMRFDEFKLLTRKSCFCLACNKKFSCLFAPFTGKGRKKRFSCLILRMNFVCSPFWLDFYHNVDSYFGTEYFWETSGEFVVVKFLLRIVCIEGNFLSRQT